MNVMESSSTRRPLYNKDLWSSILEQAKDKLPENADYNITETFMSFISATCMSESVTFGKVNDTDTTSRLNHSNFLIKA